MDKFDFGQFSSDAAAATFTTEKLYDDPGSELATRKQLSYPLGELKTYINNTIPTNSSDAPVQLVVTSEGMKYRSEVGGNLITVPGGMQMSDVINTIYPVGSIYMSINNTNPGTLFTGTTWTQLKDRFLLGAGDTYSGGDTGGAATVTLTTNEIPSHTHTYKHYAQTVNCTAGSGDTGRTVVTTAYGQSSSTSDARGGGQAHENMPPYLAVYMWKRTA